MKVLWLSHLIPFPPKGGVLQRTFNMVKEAGKYHEITLVAFNQNDFLSASIPDHEHPLDVAKRELLEFVESIHVLEIPENSIAAGKYLTALKALLKGRAYNMEWLLSDEARHVIAHILSRTSFDAVHIDTISLCVYADLFDGLPVLLNHHNFESAMVESRVKTESNFLKRLYYRYEAAQLRKSETFHCRQAHLNITCSDDDAEAMESLVGRAKFVAVPNGVDISYFYANPAVKKVAKSILIVGGLSWYPNREAVEYFMRDIWPLIKKKIPDMKVDIVGRGPTHEMLELAENDQFFRVHGFVDDVREFLWQAQFYLCPIKTGGGTKLKILDALATGCCIIADPFACKGIKVQDGREVVYSESPEEYVEAMIVLLEKPEQEASLRDAGPKLIENRYSYVGIGKMYSELVEELVNNFEERRGESL